MKYYQPGQANQKDGTVSLSQLSRQQGTNTEKRFQDWDKNQMFFLSQDINYTGIKPRWVFEKKERMFLYNFEAAQDITF